MRLGKIVDDLIVDVVGVASADVVGVVMAVAGDKVVSVDISANELVGGVGGRQLWHWVSKMFILVADPQI